MAKNPANLARLFSSSTGVGMGGPLQTLTAPASVSPPHPPLVRPPPPDDSVVVRCTEVITMPCGTEDQPFQSRKCTCVTEIWIDTFWGEFELRDAWGRTLAHSHESRVGLTRNELRTSEVGCVWYDVRSSSSEQYNLFRNPRYGVQDPGLDLGGLEVRIKFLSVPTNPERIEHIPVFLRTTALWSPSRFSIVRTWSSPVASNGVTSQLP
jgi:hypothetical protein